MTPLSLVFAVLAELLVLGVPVIFVIGIVGVGLIETQDLPYKLVTFQFLHNMQSLQLEAIPLLIVTGDLITHGRVSASLKSLTFGVFGIVKDATPLSQTVSDTTSEPDTASSHGPVTQLLSGTSNNLGHAPQYRTNRAVPTIVSAFTALSVLAAVFISVSYMLASDVYPKLVPAILVLSAILTIICTYQNTHSRSYHDGNLRSPSFLFSVFSAIWDLAIPLIVIGGVSSYIFRFSEAAMLAVIHALLGALFIHRTLALRDIRRILIQSSITSSVIIVTIGFSGLLNASLQHSGISDRIIETALSLDSTTYSTLLIVATAVVVTACLTRAVAALIILTPLVYPLTDQLGIDEFQLGFFMISLTSIGALFAQLLVELYKRPTSEQGTPSRCHSLASGYLLIVSISIFIVVSCTLSQ
ncbi:TRAP transporter large permease subunit [Halomonas sp. BN3-1]|uniref:TRAP transporter large permease subunit n=1 Tax=unclassified Halomonas TaxID=2609666 RepID=UPI000D398764|nr:TRAP transporter large permease subunit [Halomonas sp. BN3-1]